MTSAKAMLGGSRFRAAVALAVLLAGTACNKTPSGQVVATVDGDEVTRRDLIAELQAAGGKSDADLKALQPTLVNSVVSRKLLVEEAKRQRLDKNPQYLAAEQRSRELLLASMLAQTMGQRVKPLDDAGARAFVAENPLMFGGRKMLLVNQVQVDGNAVKDADLAPMKTMNDVVGYLQARKIKFQQQNKTVDTVTLPKDLAAKLLAQGAEPLGMRNGSSLVISTVVAVRDAPVPAADQVKVAKAVAQQQGSQKVVEDQIESLRKAADIKYSPGFAPTPPKTVKAS